MERKSFLDQEAPPGYIAGIGRGAMGFTTRADVGSSRVVSTSRNKRQQRNNDEDSDADDENFRDVDEDENGLLSAKLDKEDEEADLIFQKIEERMRSRGGRNKKRKYDTDNNNDEEEEGLNKNVSKISSQFVDLKQGLSTISVEQWTNLPEVGDLTKRNKRIRKEEQDNRRTYAAPDSLLAENTIKGQLETSIDIDTLTTERSKIFHSQLDNLTNTTTTTNLNTEKYLTTTPTQTTDPAEISKLRTILTQYLKTNPENPTAYITLSRLEQTANNFTKSLEILRTGTLKCSKDEDIWIEYTNRSRASGSVDALKMSKGIIADAIRSNPQAIKLWELACQLEMDVRDKIRVARLGIAENPSSAVLWKLLVSFEDEDGQETKEAKERILQKATELCSGDVELWLMLVNLQCYEDAKKSLNMARKAIPNNVDIWLRAVSLEYEYTKDMSKLSKLMGKVFKECENLTRDQWYNQAVKFEERFVAITDAIVAQVFSLDEEVSYSDLIAESTKFVSHVPTYKSILSQIVIRFPKKTAPWRTLISVYKSNYPLEALYELFETIIDKFPRNSTFRLMYSKEVWKSGNDIKRAQTILQNSLETLNDNVDIWLALIKLETTAASPLSDTVDTLFQQAQSSISNERLWHKQITHLRLKGNLEKALERSNDGLSQFPTSFKIYLQKSQILKSQNKLNEARDVLSQATRVLPTVVPLWIELSRCDQTMGNRLKARSDIDMGLLANPGNEDLLYAKLELERQLKTPISQIDQILAKSLQTNPNSAKLWSFKLAHTSNNKSTRKRDFTTALSSTSNHPLILLEIGKTFYDDAKYDKAQRWFERCLETERMFGDAYAWLYVTLEKMSDKKSLKELQEKVAEVEPNLGQLWIGVRKDLKYWELDAVGVLGKVAEGIKQQKR